MKNCEICERPVEASDRVYRQIIGYEVPRTDGGANQIRLKKYTGNHAHVDCVEDERSGVIPGQLSLA